MIVLFEGIQISLMLLMLFFIFICNFLFCFFEVKLTNKMTSQTATNRFTTGKSKLIAPSPYYQECISLNKSLPSHLLSKENDLEEHGQGSNKAKKPPNRVEWFISLFMSVKFRLDFPLFLQIFFSLAPLSETLWITAINNGSYWRYHSI